MLNAYWRSLLRGRTRQLAVIAVASVAESLLQVANLTMLIPLVGIALNDTSLASTGGLRVLRPILSWTAGLSSGRAVLLLGGIMLGLVVTKNVFSIVRQYYSARLLNQVRFDLTARLFERYMRSRYLQFIEGSRGEILYNIWEPPIQVAEVVRASSDMVATTLQIVGFCWLAAAISWRLTLFAAGTAGVSVFIYHYWFRPRLHAVTERNYTLLSRGHAWIAEAIEGVRQLKAYAAEDRILQHAHDLFGRIEHGSMIDSRLRFLPVPINDVLSTGLILGMVAAALLIPSLRLTPAYIVGFILALLRIAPLAYVALNQKIALDAARHNIHRSADLLANLPVESGVTGPIPPDTIAVLRMKNVVFSYPAQPDRRVLDGVSLEFPRGQVTALVGLSGAGKSTLADLLVRLIEPAAGMIDADGVAIDRFQLPAWRRRIGLVSQDPFIFNMSIRDNIALAAVDASVDDVERAARQARIHDVIMELPGGYAALGGDRGVKLSGGQRQRVAIARALLNRPPILIFDEATSALDNVSERLIKETIEELKRDRIVIVIAHRLSTIEGADSVVVLDKGSIVERGTPAELLQRGGLYASLYAEMARVGAPALSGPARL
jgi:ABC-type multidrug transport system fused ATPase/permease subunit